MSHDDIMLRNSRSFYSAFPTIVGSIDVAVQVSGLRVMMSFGAFRSGMTDKMF